MYEETLRNLEMISKEVGCPIEYTQGGGGNTSAKLNEELMAVKASGYKLKQITPKEGYVVVNYKKIREYHLQADLSLDRDYEKESTEFVKANVVEMEGLKTLRPSVEAGFHSLMKKYVVHTHPVYANIVCCAENGKELVKEIFEDEAFAFSWIPYINPGFSLTLRIQDAIEESLKENDKFPQVFFMENHGLITTADDAEECLRLHSLVNEKIKAYFEIKESYPVMQLSKIEENKYASGTGYLIDYFRGRDISPDFFDEIVLYPDQLVYLNGNLSVNSMDSKLNINTKTGDIIYLTNESEAQTMEESLLAYIYVIEYIRKLGLPQKSMSKEQIDFIANWESEKYRKSLVRSLGK